MNPDQARNVVKIVREQLRLQADLRSLASILTYAESSNQPPHDWLQALKLTRETPEYRRIADELEPLLVRIETAADEKEVELLLASIPPTQFPN